jgi:hypothetical protein
MLEYFYSFIHQPKYTHQPSVAPGARGGPNRADKLAGSSLDCKAKGQGFEPEGVRRAAALHPPVDGKGSLGTMELCGTLGVINATSSGPRPQGPTRDGQEAPISRAERPNRRRQEDGDMNGKRAPSTFPGMAAPRGSAPPWPQPPSIPGPAGESPIFLERE